MSKSYEDIMDAWWNKCLIQDGHTMPDFLTWNPDKKEAYAFQVCNNFPLDQLTKKQADEGVALGYLIRHYLH